MCLFSKFQSPTRAKEDLYVMKQVKAFGNGMIRSPFYNAKIELGSMMYANGDHTYQEFDYSPYYTYGKGWIHSYFRGYDLFDGEKVACIIPEGTLYNVNSSLTEVCSEKLLIGRNLYKVNDESGLEHKVEENKYKALRWLLEENINSEEVDEGWLYMKDGILVYPFDIIDNPKKIGDVIGVAYDVDKVGKVISIFSMGIAEAKWFNSIYTGKVLSKEENLSLIRGELDNSFLDDKEYDGWELPELTESFKFDFNKALYSYELVRYKKDGIIKLWKPFWINLICLDKVEDRYKLDVSFQSSHLPMNEWTVYHVRLINKISY